MSIETIISPLLAFLGPIVIAVTTPKRLYFKLTLAWLVFVLSLSLILFLSRYS